MVKLTKRLKVILNEIPNCKLLADVGCDHGYLSLAALEMNKTEKVIISDISQKSLQKAEKLLNNYLNKQVESIVSDGLKSYSVIPDVCLICGMGGEEIISILKQTDIKPKTLILQPMKNAEKVRRTVDNLGYKINKDYGFFDDNKFYDLIVANLSNDKNNYSENDFQYGKGNLSGNVDFIKYINNKINYLESFNYFNQSEKVDLERKILLLKELIK